MNTQYLTHKFRDNQRINHFRNQYELCRKDNMAKNIKKIRRQLEKDGNLDEALKYRFIPATYILPTEYHMFVEEFRSHPQGTIWIMKPVSGAQGRGIFLFTKLRDITDWKKNEVSSDVENYVVQQYISDPYLIGGKKFDLRLYVLVTSYTPLKAWFNREGFARFSNTRYSVASIDDAFVHLTNVAVQKTAPDYDPDKGVKWSLHKLRRYFTAKHGEQLTQNLLRLIDEIIVLSLQSVNKVIIQDSHCFELYGYDIMIDKYLKPWLLEVNASPSLTASSQEDFELKCRVLNDVLTVVDMEGKLKGNEQKIGGFDLFWSNGPVMYDPGAERHLPGVMALKLNTHFGNITV